MMRRLGILALCVSTMVGCTDGLFTSTDDKGKKGDDESADPPANVNGSFYLTCQYVNLAQPSRPQADLGCVVKDTTQDKKVVITEVSKGFDWSSVDLPDEQRLGVETRVTPYGDTNPDYHVMYSFIGTNAAVVNDVANKTSIQLFVRPLTGSATEVKAFEATVAQATQSQVAPESNGIFGEKADGTADPGKVPGLR